MKKFLLASIFGAVALSAQTGPLSPNPTSSLPAQVIRVSSDHSTKPGRVIVKFRNSNGPSFLPGSGASHGLGQSGLYVVENPPGMSSGEAIGKYKQSPNVLYAEPDSKVSTTATPSDPLWGQQWDMVKISAPAAWNVNTGAADVIVAVIDTGVDYTHPDLKANLWTNPSDGSHGFTCLNGVCVSGGQDDFGHGTHVAGTIGAVANNGAGMSGINWRTQILSCKFLDSSGGGSVSDAVLCFNQLLTLRQQGFNIRVTNNSWGGGDFSQSLKDAMEAAAATGIVNICAAGNNGANADVAPMYPGAYNSPGIVSVLASDQNDMGASFTNYGLGNVDIAAPGVSTLSTVPTGTCPLCDPTGYRVASGTSMATPHVTGVVAAMLQLHPALTAPEARDALLDPASYDVITDNLGSMTSTGGRLNLYKAITNPILSAPKLNQPPTVTAFSGSAAAGQTITLSATSSDPDNDPLRTVWRKSGTSPWLLGWMLNSTSAFPVPSGSSLSFQAPALARTAVASYTVSVADGRGGGATDIAYATALPKSNPGLPPYGTMGVSPSTGPVGTVVTVSFPAVDPEGGPVGWDLWQTGQNTGFGACCQTASTYSLTMSAAGAYRITTQAIDKDLNFSSRQTAVVRIGGATGTPPIANATFDKLTGSAPLTVNIDMSGSYDPDGTIQQYIVYCRNEVSQEVQTGKTGSCVYDTPGTYWIWIQVFDNDNLLDTLSAYAVVTPASQSSGTPKQTAAITLGNLSQTYSGSALTPTATTTPAGLSVVWTNAPQTNAGAYAVTATINDPNYQGSASGTFTIAKKAATVILSNLSQTYTGSALTPTALTTPAGLAVAWTNAPQTNAGAYAVTGTVNDPNYQGSASGTFTIAKKAATVTLSNLTQAYTGSALTPTALTTPAGLAVAWTNAPQTNVGAYAVTAAINDPNYQGSAGGTFTISSSTTPVVPPGVSITSPTAGTIVAGRAITIQAAVSQGSNPIARIDFLVNGTVKCSPSAAPFSCSWNAPNAVGKKYDIQAIAYDTTNVSGKSSVVTVTASH